MELQKIDAGKFRDYITEMYSGTYFSRISTEYICIAELGETDLVVMDFKTLEKIVSLGGEITASGFSVTNYEDTISLANNKEPSSTENLISYKDMYHVLRAVDKDELVRTYNRVKNVPFNILNISVEDNKIVVLSSPEDAVRDIDNLRQRRTITYNLNLKALKERQEDNWLADQDTLRTNRAIKLVKERAEILERERIEAQDALDKKVTNVIRQIPKGLDQRHKALVINYIGKDVKTAEENTWAVHTIITHKKPSGQIVELKYVLARLDLANVKNANELKRVINGRESLEAMLLNGEKIINAQMLQGRTLRGKELVGKRQYSTPGDIDEKERRAATSKGYSLVDTKLVNVEVV